MQLVVSMQYRRLPPQVRNTMRTAILILFLLFFQFQLFGQETVITIMNKSALSKIIILIILAIVSIHNFIKWNEENNRTEP